MATREHVILPSLNEKHIEIACNSDEVTMRILYLKFPYLPTNFKNQHFLNFFFFKHVIFVNQT